MILWEENISSEEEVSQEMDFPMEHWFLWLIKNLLFSKINEKLLEVILNKIQSDSINMGDVYILGRSVESNTGYFT